MSCKLYLNLLIGCVIVVLSSCAPRIYLPDRVNAPMLQEAGEVKLTSSVKIQNNKASSITALSPSFDFAVSPAQNFGIIGSFRHTNKYADDDDDFDFNYQDSIRYTGNRAEFGAGVYVPMGRRGLFELYGGGGIGLLERNNLKRYAGNYQTRYYQIFVQPSLGFHVNDIFEFCGGMKFNIHKFHDFKSDTSAFRYEFTEPRVDIESPTFLIVGPFINLSVGHKYVKFNMQCGSNFNVGRPSLLANSFPFYVSMGITVGFAPRFNNMSDREAKYNGND